MQLFLLNFRPSKTFMCMSVPVWEKKNLILTDLFIKVLATLPKQVHHQNDRNIFQAWICLMGFKRGFQAWMMSTISNIITYISKFSVQKRI